MKSCSNNECENAMYLLPPSHFYKDVRLKDNLSSWCKKCTNKHNRLKVIEKSRGRL